MHQKVIDALKVIKGEDIKVWGKKKIKFQDMERSIQLDIENAKDIINRVGKIKSSISIT